MNIEKFNFYHEICYTQIQLTVLSVIPQILHQKKSKFIHQISSKKLNELLNLVSSSAQVTVYTVKEEARWPTPLFVMCVCIQV